MKKDTFTGMSVADEYPGIRHKAGMTDIQKRISENGRTGRRFVFLSDPPEGRVNLGYNVTGKQKAVDASDDTTVKTLKQTPIRLSHRTSIAYADRQSTPQMHIHWKHAPLI
jgi:hypothetical protein